MIHLLEISPDLSVEQIKKLARRYAMTGGYEVGLKSGLNACELGKLCDLYMPELKNYPAASARLRSSIAWRVLELIVEKPELEEKLKLETKKQMSEFVGIELARK